MAVSEYLALEKVKRGGEMFGITVSTLSSTWQCSDRGYI